LLQVAANPLAAALGSPEQSHFRLTLSQAFNSLGTVAGPLIGAAVILRGGVFNEGGDAETNRAATLHQIDVSALFLAIVVSLLAFGLWRVRGHLVTRGLAPDSEEHSPFEALKSRWAVFGAISIFLYVGAEVSVGSVIINFLIQPSILGVVAEKAGYYLSLYWGGAMVGRFIGSALMTRFRAGVLMTIAATTAACLCLLVSQTGGPVAAVAVLSIGLFNSIMFPTIFTLTLERSSAPAAATSGLLCMAIVGGAILPKVVGMVADEAGLSATFLIPAAAYFAIAWFAFATTRKPAARVADVAQSAH
jgi:FHS family L-fucose permease-like MFS transporter